LRDRELLAAADFFEAVCWIGARLAEAIDYAHSQGTLHRDIKPGNILVNPYGRPLLADFNLAHPTRRIAEADSYGGTLAYMAPEHLDAFNPETVAAERAMDERSDLYSLGVVLYEMLTGSRPFAHALPDGNLGTALRAMAAERRVAAPSPRREWPEVPELLDHVVRRCLDPEPARRYPTGAALAQALEGCREHRRVERELPQPGPLTRAALRRPFLWLAILALLPHILGSLVNISFNVLHIVGRLGAEQRSVFADLVIAYNLVVYPACLSILTWLVMRVVRVWQGMQRQPSSDDNEVSAARRRALSWPAWAVVLACVGWLPGGLLFPLGIHVLAGPVSATVFGQFIVSFTLSGLIALTYSYFGVEFLVLRVIYPRLWLEAAGLRRTMAAELSGHGSRLRLFQFLAGVIPLIGAALMMAAGPEAIGAIGFRLLTVGLLCAGMAGFGLALFAGSLLTRTLALYANTSVP
jgi:hypothetical protein